MRKISRQERELQLLKLLSGTPFKFVEWPYGFRNNKSTVTLNCPKHGDWSTGFTNIIKGTRCSKCRLDERTHNGDQVLDKISLILPKGQELIGFVNGYKNNSSKVKMKCERHGEWVCSVLHLLHSGSGCKKCGYETTGMKRRLELDETMTRLNKCEKYEFVSFIEEYKNGKSKIKMKCDSHGEWVTNVVTVLSNKHGCPSCSKCGYDPKTKGHLYLLRSECGRYFKVGITNNIKRRLNELKRSTPFDFVHLESFKGDGQIVFDIEKAFHANFKKAKMKGFNGATEWFLWDGDVIEWFRLL